jgi:hypothetical protein
LDVKESIYSKSVDIDKSKPEPEVIVWSSDLFAELDYAMELLYLRGSNGSPKNSLCPVKARNRLSLGNSLSLFLALSGNTFAAKDCGAMVTEIADSEMPRMSVTLSHGIPQSNKEMWQPGTWALTQREYLYATILLYMRLVGWGLPSFSDLSRTWGRYLLYFVRNISVFLVAPPVNMYTWSAQSRFVVLISTVLICQTQARPKARHRQLQCKSSVVRVAAAIPHNR